MAFDQWEISRLFVDLAGIRKNQEQQIQLLERIAAALEKPMPMPAHMHAAGCPARMNYEAPCRMDCANKPAVPATPETRPELFLQAHRTYSEAFVAALELDTAEAAEGAGVSPMHTTGPDALDFLRNRQHHVPQELDPSDACRYGTSTVLGDAPPSGAEKLPAEPHDKYAGAAPHQVRGWEPR